MYDRHLVMDLGQLASRPDRVIAQLTEVPIALFYGSPEPRREVIPHHPWIEPQIGHQIKPVIFLQQLAAAVDLPG